MRILTMVLMTFFISGCIPAPPPPPIFGTDMFGMFVFFIIIFVIFYAIKFLKSNSFYNNEKNNSNAEIIKKLESIERRIKNLEEKIFQKKGEKNEKN